MVPFLPLGSGCRVGYGSQRYALSDVPTPLEPRDGVEAASSLWQLCDAFACQGRDFTRPLNNSHSDQQEGMLGNRLGLVRACRQTYSEAIPLLYTRSIFHFAHRDVLNAFTITVRPERLSAIRRLSLTLANLENGHWSLSSLPFSTHDDPTWYGMWNTIRDRLTGLRELSLLLYPFRLIDANDENTLDAQGERWPIWMQPMLVVRGLTWCEICFARYQQSDGLSQIIQVEELEGYRLRLQEAMKRPKNSQPGTGLFRPTLEK